MKQTVMNKYANDYDYLTDKEVFLSKITLYIKKEYKSYIEAKLQAFIEKLEKLSNLPEEKKRTEINRIRTNLFGQDVLYTEADILALKKNPLDSTQPLPELSYLEKNHIQAGFHAAFYRYLKLEKKTETMLDRKAFKNKLDNEYSFLKNEAEKDLEDEEEIRLCRFLDVLTYIKDYSSEPQRALSLIIGAYLESSDIKKHYVIGGRLPKGTDRRLQLIDHVLPVKKRKMKLNSATEPTDYDGHSQHKKKRRININENEIEIETAACLLTDLQKSSVVSSFELIPGSLEKETTILPNQLERLDNKSLESPYYTTFEKRDVSAEKKMQLSERDKAVFFQSDDYTYLQDKKTFLNKISLRLDYEYSFLDDEFRGTVKQKLAEFVNNLENGTEKISDNIQMSQRLISLIKGQNDIFFLFDVVKKLKAEEYRNNGQTKKLKQLTSRNRKEITAAFLSVYIRHLILTDGYTLEKMSCLNDDLSTAKKGKIYLQALPNTYFVKGMTEPQLLPNNIDLTDFEQRLQDVKFKQMILAVTSEAGYTSEKKKFLARLDDEYMSFLVKPTMLVEEINYLYQFERAISLVKKDWIGEGTKGLLLAVGNILEDSGDHRCYITGGHQNWQTSDRLNIIGHIFGLKKQQRKPRNSSLTSLYSIYAPPRQDYGKTLEKFNSTNDVAEHLPIWQDDYVYLQKEEDFLQSAQIKMQLNHTNENAVIDKLKQFMAILKSTIMSVDESKSSPVVSDLFNKGVMSTLFQGETQNLTKLNPVEIESINSVFMSAFIRHIILITRNQTDTKLQRAKFLEKLDLLNVSLPIQSPEPCNQLYRFERAISLLKQYLSVKNNKTLFCSVGELLENNIFIPLYNDNISVESKCREALIGSLEREELEQGQVLEQNTKKRNRDELMDGGEDNNESLMTQVESGAPALMHSSSSSKTYALPTIDLILWEKHKNLLLIYWAYQKWMESDTMQTNDFEADILLEKLNAYPMSDRQLLSHEIYTSKENYLNACENNLSECKKEAKNLPFTVTSGIFPQKAIELKKKIQRLNKIIEEVKVSEELGIIANSSLSAGGRLDPE